MFTVTLPSLLMRLDMRLEKLWEQQDIDYLTYRDMTICLKLFLRLLLWAKCYFDWVEEDIKYRYKLINYHKHIHNI